MVIKIEFTPLSDCKMLPFFKRFKKITELVNLNFPGLMFSGQTDIQKYCCIIGWDYDQ